MAIPGDINSLEVGKFVETGTGTVAIRFASLATSFLGTTVIPTSDTVTSGTTAVTIGGLVRGLTLITPAMTGTGTATFKLLDASDGTLISQAQAESVTAYYGTASPINDSMSFVLTANGTQSSAATTVYRIHYDR